jgi:hypothetical protein
MGMFNWFKTKNKEEIYYGVKESEILKYCDDDVREHILNKGYSIDDLGFHSINEYFNFIRYNVAIIDIFGCRKDYKKEWGFKRSM